MLKYSASKNNKSSAALSFLVSATSAYPSHAFSPSPFYMERHRCGLCSRRFSSGRALGGHMRRHVSAFTSPPRVHFGEIPPLVTGDVTAKGAEEEEEIAEEAAAYELRENPRKSFRLVDPEFSAAADPDGSSSVVVEDGESETESPWAAFVPFHRRRSKRPRHAPVPPETGSSASDVTTEEDVARCLMMLSRGHWTGSSKESLPSDGDDDEEGGSRPVAVSSLAPRRSRSKHCCSICKKAFRSHRSLSNHRSTHQSQTVCGPGGRSPPSTGGEDSAANANARVHECPFCFRSFASGQALGGHKRTHFIIASPPASTSTTAKSSGGFALVDLNLPAPVEDDTALSVVSDAEFIAKRTR